MTEVPGIHHGRIVMTDIAISSTIMTTHPGIINYRAGGLGMSPSPARGWSAIAILTRQSIFSPTRKGVDLWTKWVPQIVVEVVSRRREDRDYVEKREEYLRVGVIEYWIFDPRRRMLVLLRRRRHLGRATSWARTASIGPNLLPGLEARLGELLGHRPMTTRIRRRRRRLTRRSHAPIRTNRPKGRRWPTRSTTRISPSWSFGSPRCSRPGRTRTPTS